MRFMRCVALVIALQLFFATPLARAEESSTMASTASIAIELELMRGTLDKYRQALVRSGDRSNRYADAFAICAEEKKELAADQGISVPTVLLIVLASIAAGISVGVVAGVGLGD